MISVALAAGLVRVIWAFAWDDPNPPDQHVNRYEIQWRVDGSAWTTLATDQKYIGGVVIPVTLDGDGEARVRACNESACSEYSPAIPLDRTPPQPAPWLQHGG